MDQETRINILIDKIHQKFPFEKIQALFVALELDYDSISLSYPSVGDLKTITHYLLENVIREAYEHPDLDYFNQINKFRADYTAGNKNVTLTFVLYGSNIII